MQNKTESPVAALRQAAVDRVKWAGEFTDSLIDSLSDDQITARAGGVGNHAAWVMGHIAWTSDFILSMVTGGGRHLPDTYDEHFAGGTQPNDDASVYPARAELREAVQQTRRRLIGWTESLTEETAFDPLPEMLLEFAPNAIQLPFTVAAHDLFHLGQVATVRASLGLGPVHR